MLDGPVSDAVEGAALSHHQDYIDIYSASWGPEDDGRTVDGPGRLAKEAFLKGTTEVRLAKVLGHPSAVCANMYSIATLGTLFCLF